ncbi:U-box domain-containing protein 4 [Nymphaea thermarum]|nr:U-box domain-containing protein 4 [Nymphaea thermarum]
MDAVDDDNSLRFDTPSSIYSYLGRNLDGLSLKSHSSASAFSDCNSDRSSEFSQSSGSRNLLIAACTSDRPDDDDAIAQLVLDLESTSLETQRNAAMEIRLLAKNKTENRIRIADAGGIPPLVVLAQSPDAQIQELGVTALLNLSLCDENKDRIVGSGAVRALVRALKTGTAATRENAACAILRLSYQDDIKAAFGRAGAIPPLVSLLENGTLRGKKDAAGALYAMTTMKENKLRAVEAGVMRSLVDLMSDFEYGMVDKAALVTQNLVSLPQARTALVEEGGIPVVVEAVEVGTQRQKEFAAGILLALSEGSLQHRLMIAREGAIPPLIALTQSGTTRSKQKLPGLAVVLVRFWPVAFG